MSERKFESVIGLEVHAQLKTKSKIFCGCSTQFGMDENVNTCPICTGMPGSLPVLNKRTVEFALKMALATHCRVNSRSIFARKNYFYPDLPKGYQISQYDKPLAEEGFIEIEMGENKKRIGLVRIHMEEDAGKNVHIGNKSYINLNRAGVPLIEIVSKPDMRSSEEASLYLKEIRKILLYLEISEGNMEEGNLRCDVNISLRLEGESRLGTRAEIKNINSFRFVEKAIQHEIERQREILEGGGRVPQETRLWDADQEKTYPMRSKEEAHDYRYFPEPDLLPLAVSDEWRQEIEKNLPELPSPRKEKFMNIYGLSSYDAGLLVEEKSLGDYFEKAAKLSQKPKQVCNWILTELLSRFKMEEVFKSSIPAENLSELIGFIDRGVISGKIAKEVFSKMVESGKKAKEIIEAEGLSQLSDSNLLESVVEKILKENKDAVEKYLSGNEKLFSFFVGQAMKQTQGKANPSMVNEILKKKLRK